MMFNIVLRFGILCATQSSESALSCCVLSKYGSWPSLFYHSVLYPCEKVTFSALQVKGVLLLGGSRTEQAALVVTDPLTMDCTHAYTKHTVR